MANLGRAPVVLPGHVVITPVRASRWMTAYASVLELLRHGRPVAFLAGAIAGGLLVAAFSAAVLRGATEPRRAEDPEAAGSTPAVSAARTTATHQADDVLPASASPRDDPAAVVLAVRASPVPRSHVVAIAEDHGIDGEHFADTMWCESRFLPDAIGDGGRAVGIAQWHAPTWATSTRRYYGMELAPAMRLDPDFALLVAARKWAAEGPWAWTCANR